MISKENDKVGANIRRWRKTKGRTRPTMAKRMGITVEQLDDYENGHDEINIGVVIMASKAIPCNPMLLIANVEPPKFKTGVK